MAMIKKEQMKIRVSHEPSVRRTVLYARRLTQVGDAVLFVSRSCLRQNPMEARFLEKLEKRQANHDAHLPELHAKIGQLSVERDY